MSNVIPISEAEALREEVEQLRVQLAGCLTAAEGWGQKCYAGDYGWSPAYQAVIELRKLYEKSAQQNMHWTAGIVRRFKQFPVVKFILSLWYSLASRQ